MCAGGKRPNLVSVYFNALFINILKEKCFVQFIRFKY